MQVKTRAAPLAQIPGEATAGRLDEQLCFALYAAGNAMTRVFRPLLQQLGLTYPQYLVLLVLWEHRELRLGQIAEKLGLATHAVSPVIDRLESSGLVIRVIDATDRRAVKVHLTSAGIALESLGAEIQEAARCRTHLSDDVITTLRSSLIGLAENLGSQ